jgi:hypothetical protein
MTDKRLNLCTAQEAYCVAAELRHLRDSVHGSDYKPLD